jgi:hypothetical protein
MHPPRTSRSFVRPSDRPTAPHNLLVSSRLDTTRADAAAEALSWVAEALSGVAEALGVAIPLFSLALNEWDLILSLL